MQYFTKALPYILAVTATLVLGCSSGTGNAEFRASFDCRNAPREYKGPVAPPYGSVPNTQIAYVLQTGVPENNRAGVPVFTEQDGTVTVSMLLRKPLSKKQVDEITQEAAKASGCTVQ